MWLDKFNEIRKESGMSLDEISAKSGVPKGTLSKITAGITKAPPLETMRKLVYSMGYTLDDLDDSPKGAKKAPLYSSEAEKLAWDYDKLDGHGQKAVRAVADVEMARCAELAQAMPTQELAEIIYTVPGYALPMSAGAGEPAGQEPPEDYSLKKAPPRGTSYIARVHGRSMEPTYFDGQLVFVHATEEIPVGKIGVFFMDGQQWVKELGAGELTSHNSDYAPRAITEGTRCQGLVLGVCDDSYFE